MEEFKKNIFFETPRDKWKAFQKSRLVMFSEGHEVENWENTQPLYFYPFTWLDYLNKTGIRELHIIDSSNTAIKDALNSLKAPGKVYFENLNIEEIKIAKYLGHKISIICNFKDLMPSYIPILAETDFIKIRADKQNNLSLLEGLPNKNLLSCIKVYAGDHCDYENLAIQSKNIGFNLFHVAKKLVADKNYSLTEKEKEVLCNLKELESTNFRILVPSSLDKIYAEKFRINPLFNNTRECSFSNYRTVLYKDKFYPCYTKTILSSGKFEREGIINKEGRKEDCDDCACIYENDMLSNIETKMKKYKRPYFALEYENDR